MGHHSMSVSDSTVLSGLGAGHSLTSGRTPTRPYGWTWRRSGQELRNTYVITKSTEHAPLRRFFSCSRRAAVSFRQIASDVRTTEVATCTDAGGGGGL